MLYRDYDMQDWKSKFKSIHRTLQQYGVYLDFQKYIDTGIRQGRSVKDVVRGLVDAMNTQGAALDEKAIDFILLYIDLRIDFRTCKFLYTDKLADHQETKFDYEFWKGLHEREGIFYIDCNYNDSFKHVGLSDVDGAACEIKIRSSSEYLGIAVDFYSTVTKRFSHCSSLFIPFKSDVLYVNFADDKLNNRDLDGLPGCRVRKRKLTSFIDGYYPDEDMYYLREIVLGVQGVLRAYYDASGNRKVKSTNRTTRLHKTRGRVSEIMIQTEGSKFVPLSRTQVSYQGSREGKGGHHSSPVPHSVSGHWRHYKNKTVWIEGYYKPSKGYKGEQPIRFVDVDR